MDMSVQIPSSAPPQMQITSEFSMRDKCSLENPQAMQGLDFLSMIFQQLQGDSENIQNDEMLKQLKEQLDIDGTENSMQLAAEMLNMGLNPILFQQVNNTELSEQNLELLKAVNSSKEIQSVIKENSLINNAQNQINVLKQEGNPTENNFAVSDTQKEIFNTAKANEFSDVSPKNNADSEKNEIKFSANKSENLKIQEKESEPFEVINVKAETKKPSEFERLTAQNRFERDAKSVLKEVKKTENTPKEDMDIEKLQKEVKSGVHLSNNISGYRSFEVSSFNKTEIEPNSQIELMKQVETGIKTGIKDGKNEFSFKLKPEGLGEITVKMVEESGKIAMNIIASSSKVERILNSELSALQQSLKNYHVEVKPVITEASETSNYSSMNYGHNFSQHNSQHNQQFQQNGSLYWQSSKKYNDLQENDFNLNEPIVYQKEIYKSSALDTYI